MDNGIFVSWTATKTIGVQRQKLYKYYLITAAGNRILAATALCRDAKHYTYKYDALFVEEYSVLVEDVGLFELKNIMSIPRWLEHVIVSVSSYAGGPPFPSVNANVYGPEPCCFTVRYAKNKKLPVSDGLIPIIRECRQRFMIVKAKDVHWLITLRNFEFGQGWKDFAEDHNLQTGDVVLFKHLGGMEFNTMIFTKNCQQQIYSWTIQLTHKPEADPFASMHFDASSCVYQQIVTGLTDDFVQNLSFPAFYCRITREDCVELKLPFKMTGGNKKKDDRCVVKLCRQNVHAEVVYENKRLTEGWMEFYNQIDARMYELLFFFPTAELNYQVIICGENGSEKYTLQDGRMVLRSYEFETTVAV